MKTEHIQLIVEQLNILIAKSSQKKVANMAKVSNATISQMVNNKHDHIAESMWIKVKVNLKIDWGWNIVPTQNLLTVKELLKDIQSLSMSAMISDAQGIGKTTGYKEYQKENDNVILIECKNYWSKKSFARHQLLACGLDTHGTTEEMIEAFAEYLSKQNKALVIYDQFDKLKEVQKDLFMDYYNDLDGECAFLLSGVKHLAHQEKKGRNKNKMGYAERWSRVGSKAIPLGPISLNDVALMCKANGLTDLEVIEYIYENCEGDARRVKREVEKYFLMEAENKAA
ncbi:AAA family ATPase [Wenyingzhuangia aestuarii]|uniref:AAA family ATPase n=1 Tax=Wenyingzhuangia aestuarii TaxID=1647582 RepID=UPI00143CAB9A|nr:AAA family ATPase [Wenyingzhuangia aestuarii]NJB83655.1 DNA transposition AAA+ family ATPase [Wenyingzhuangia aestuarii]